jgi:3-hydroxybutyrate dehydrogenase
MSGQLDGRVVLVTGGTRGLGRAVADAFLREGARVMVTGRSEETGRQALADFGAGGAVSFVAGDVTRQADCEHAVEAAIARHGRILVTCAVEGKLGRPGAAGYAAAKHAVTGLVKSVAHEVGTLGITVNAILPGALAPCAQPGPDLPGRSLIERPNTFDEVASVAVLLASPSMASITGCLFPVDGGTMPY